MSFWLYNGDCIEVMKQWPDSTFDAVCTDPPYELNFMNKGWDAAGIAFSPELWAQALRMLKPGAHLLAFGGTRTYHRMTCAIEDAGFEIRDSLHWFYGTGFPKSMNLGNGRGTALKPAHEPIVLARRPIEGTIAQNLEKYGTGALNIDVSTVGGGRWPANVLLDESAAAELDSQTPDLKEGGTLKGGEGRECSVVSPLDLGPRGAWESYGDSGGASRFFFKYVAKPGRKERDLGCDHLPMKSAGEVTDRVDGTAGLKSPRAGAGRTSGARNIHPTVKPIELMRYLCRLITPPGGVVLDPFLGSGTTGIGALREGFKFVGIEKEVEYITIAHARISAGLKEAA